MKKITLILFIVLLGVSVATAQKNNSVFDKNTTELSSQQKENNTENSNIPKFTVVNGKFLNVSNVETGSSIEIYSALGAKVQTITYNNNPISLVNLNKGVYIVRTGKYTQKIML